MAALGTARVQNASLCFAVVWPCEVGTAGGGTIATCIRADEGKKGVGLDLVLMKTTQIELDI